MGHSFVSVIIPVLNNAEGLTRTLKAINKQTYPRKYFEVIVVDNGSEKSPKDIVQKHNAIYIKEHHFLGSPYSARNRGLEVAKYEIIALLDATCSPVEEWLEEGVTAIEAGSDLCGGDVVFDLNENSSIGEIYDSLTNIRMKESIKERNVAKTTNLFIKKEVFDSVGRFPEGLRSGGDVLWTGRATLAGFKLVFGEKAKVYITPRPLKPLLRKTWRVAKGQPAIWLENSTYYSNFIKKCLLFFVPPNPSRIKKTLSNESLPQKPLLFLRLFFTAYLLKLLKCPGTLIGYIICIKKIRAIKGRNNFERLHEQSSDNNGKQHL